MIRAIILAALIASPAFADVTVKEQDVRPVNPKRFSYGTFHVDQSGTAPDAVNSPRHLLNGGIDTQDLSEVSGTVTLKQPAKTVWFRILDKEREIYGPPPEITIDGQLLTDARRAPKMNGWVLTFGRSVKSFAFTMGKMIDKGWRASAHSLYPGACQ